MSQTHLESVLRQLERQREDLDRKRIKTSEACKDLVTFCEKTEDPFDPKYEKSFNNPFKAKTGISCLII